MVTMDGNPSFIQFLAFKLGKSLDRKIDRARESTRARSIYLTLIRLVLQIVGFSCLTFAGFTWSIAAGLVVAGISCFTLSWLAGSNPPDASTNR